MSDYAGYEQRCTFADDCDAECAGVGFIHRAFGFVESTIAASIVA